MKFLKKYNIKIAEDIKVLYVSNTSIITLIGPLGQKSLKIKLKIYIDQYKNTIYVSNIPIETYLLNKTKLLKSLQGTTISQLKQSLLEVSVVLNKKLELVGVGYKVFLAEKPNNNFLLHFKLGFSHPLFFKINPAIKVFCYKSINLYLFSNSLKDVSQLAARIKAHKFPEPYKGKGILYKNEKIKIKEGKKI